MAEVGGIVKVSGSRMATPLAPPRPGSTPMIVPSMMPTTATKRLNGVTATEKPRRRFSKPIAQKPSQASSGPLGIGTRNHRSKITKVTTGMPRPQRPRSWARRGGRPSACRRPGRARRPRRGRDPRVRTTMARRRPQHRQHRPELGGGDERRWPRPAARSGRGSRRRWHHEDGQPEREEAALRPLDAPADAEAEGVGDDDAAQQRSAPAR